MNKRASRVGEEADTSNSALELAVNGAQVHIPQLCAHLALILLHFLLVERVFLYAYEVSTALAHHVDMLHK